MAATRTVAKTAKDLPAKVLPPSSPFGELLRRSRFASYDPNIRQAYSAPPSYIHRGNWGLKRPIAHRNRDGAIVLKQYEEHAHYIEWDRAEEQVKFIKQIEELNTRPQLTMGTPWFAALGPAALKDSAVDSEFSHSEDSNLMGTVEKLPQPPRPPPVPEVRPAPSTKMQPPPLTTLDKIDVNLSGLGNSGKGAYGAPRPPSALPSTAGIQPNVNAMSPKQFQAYVESLRKLRPAFLKFLRQELSRTRKERNITSAIDPEGLTDDQLVIELGREGLVQDLHKIFLEKHFKEKFASEDPESEIADAMANANKPQPIQQQPHKFAGLMYAMPTDIETYFSGQAQPGLIVQDANPTNLRDYHAGLGETYITSFAGLAMMLAKGDAGPNVAPLIQPYTEEGIHTPRVRDKSGNDSISTSMAERRMRLSKLQLSTPPKVVGTSAHSHPLKTIKILGTVVVDEAIDRSWRDNPYPPGSMDYVKNAPNEKSSSPRPLAMGYKLGGGMPPMYGMKNKRLPEPRTQHDRTQQASNSNLLNMLQTMSKKVKSTEKPPVDKK
ncbi:hypothetical protein M413DRAFT_437841 [Hebeloma cylindrosporum]|uniref:Uncharacterized protein n=1 Tax=Hebeloma cylindrosporum TaxID=76867 RepID=A0A0C3CWZ8_HEBCY|nr:hypothetical protein M413DRAFT_437841 [Hebeloma cylindrosporum h7]